MDHPVQTKYISIKPFVPWKQVPRPIRWEQVFDRSAPLEVEIGFGLGDFLVAQARAYPEKDFVGIELGWPQVRLALRKIGLAGVPNVRIIRAHAAAALERIFTEASIHAVYALFPCPWPKNRHAKHRLFSSPFLELLNSRLIPKGEVLMVTDYQPYYNWVLNNVNGSYFVIQTDLVPPRFSTKYERKWRGLGQEAFFQLRLKKAQHIPIPVKEDIALIIHRIRRFDPDRFHPVRGRGEIMVEGKEFIYDPKRKKGMVRCVVGEEQWFQEFWIEIVHAEDLWHIRPAKGCSIVPTAGVQQALDMVRDVAVGKG
jgi:tRNA (guanine-N7-)-methyltransferase